MSPYLAPSLKFHQPTCFHSVLGFSQKFKQQQHASVDWSYQTLAYLYVLTLNLWSSNLEPGPSTSATAGTYNCTFSHPPQKEQTKILGEEPSQQQWGVQQKSSQLLLILIPTEVSKPLLPAIINKQYLYVRVFLSCTHVKFNSNNAVSITQRVIISLSQVHVWVCFFNAADSVFNKLFPEARNCVY